MTCCRDHKFRVGVVLLIVVQAPSVFELVSIWGLFVFKLCPTSSFRQYSAGVGGRGGTNPGARLLSVALPVVGAAHSAAKFRSAISCAAPASSTNRSLSMAAAPPSTVSSCIVWWVVWVTQRLSLSIVACLHSGVMSYTSPWAMGAELRP